MTDCKTLIIGAGPAGLSAAIYLARFKIDTTVIYEEEEGSALARAGVIDNYPGVEEHTGYDLLNKFREQAENLQVNFKIAGVTKIEDMDSYKNVTMTLPDGSEQVLSAEAILIATGTKPRKLGIEGEDTIAGISYCAVCDAPLYKDKTVAVIGGGESAFAEANLLSEYCKKVYILHRGENFRRVNGKLWDKVAYKGNVILTTNVRVIDFDTCDNSITGLKLVYGEKTSISPAYCTLPVDGCFLAMGGTPNVLSGFDLEKDGRLKVDCNYATSMNGVYAAGDCATEKKQVIVAASSGVLAAFGIKEFLER